MFWKSVEKELPKYTGTYLVTCYVFSELGSFYDVRTVNYHKQRIGYSDKFKEDWVYPKIQSIYEGYFSVLYWTEIPFPAMQMHNEFDGYVEELEVKFPENK